MIRTRGIIMVTAMSVILLAVSCANIDASFKFGWTYETDRIVNISGQSNLHVGGELSSFNIEFENLDSVDWQTPYCIALVDEERLISIFFESEIDLAPGEKSSVTATGIFPEGPIGKRYGLRFVIPGEVIEVSDCSPPV